MPTLYRSAAFVHRGTVDQVCKDCRRVVDKYAIAVINFGVCRALTAIEVLSR